MSAPTMPKGIAAKTIIGLTALRNWNTSARKISTSGHDEHHDNLPEALDALLLLRRRSAMV